MDAAGFKRWAPVYDEGRVFLAMGEDPSHGDGPSLVHAISPNGQGDVTDSRRLWTCREVGRVVETSCWATEELLARIDMDAPLYSRPALVGDVLYLASAHRLYRIATKGGG
jgi:hypothetical protein